MQKAVFNALVLTGLHKDPDGFRELYMDNWYSVLELLAKLKMWYETYK